MFLRSFYPLTSESQLKVSLHKYLIYRNHISKNENNETIFNEAESLKTLIFFEDFGYFLIQIYPLKMRILQKLDATSLDYELNVDFDNIFVFEINR